MAKLWLLVAPGGKLTCTINLPQWCRDNAALLVPASPEEAENRIRALSVKMSSGQIAHPQWRGWQLLEPARDLDPLIATLPPTRAPEHHKTRRYQTTTAKPVTTVAQTGPRSGAPGDPFVLVSPDGKTYAGSSLNGWCKQHPELFAPTSSRIAAVSLARAKRAGRQWRGWRIADTLEELQATAQ